MTIFTLHPIGTNTKYLILRDVQLNFQTEIINLVQVLKKSCMSGQYRVQADFVTFTWSYTHCRTKIVSNFKTNSFHFLRPYSHPNWRLLHAEAVDGGGDWVHALEISSRVGGKWVRKFRSRVRFPS